MNQPVPTDPTQQRHDRAYYQLTHTLYSLLPPPLDNTAEALLARNEAAKAIIVDMAPVNAEETDLAAHVVAVRAQAQHVLRQLRLHDGDPKEALRLSVHFAHLERTAAALRNQLRRLQLDRHRRDADSATASSDEWVRYIAGRRMDAAEAQRGAPPVGVPPVGVSLGVPVAAATAPAHHAEPPPAPEPAPAIRMPPPPRRAVPDGAAPQPTPTAALLLRQRAQPLAESGEPPRDLDAEVAHYVAVYPRRALAIRRHGGIPPDCDFGPPDDELAVAIVAAAGPTLRDLDAAIAA